MAKGRVFPWGFFDGRLLLELWTLFSCDLCKRWRDHHWIIIGATHFIRTVKHFASQGLKPSDHPESWVTGSTIEFFTRMILAFLS